MESDSKSLIDHLSARARPVNLRLNPSFSRISKVATVFQSILWSWTAREANHAADLVASLAWKKMSDDIWVSHHPSSLVHVLSRDGLPCPKPPLNPSCFWAQAMASCSPP
ncbi:hypothetical protein FF1_010077 [Malus domestica]